jgi:porphobilinogen synthase
MFIAEGENEENWNRVDAGIFRRSIDLTLEEIKEIMLLGIRATFM